MAGGRVTVGEETSGPDMADSWNGGLSRMRANTTGLREPLRRRLAGWRRIRIGITRS